MMPERRRLLDRLIREIYRGELQAIEHAARTERLVGATPPADALSDVAKHAAALRDRFDVIVAAYDLQTGRTAINAALSSLRGLVGDRVHEPERAYRTCLLDLRHGIDVVKLAREVARTEELFGVIRWCDDWLGARRTLVARVEAQLTWFADEAGVSLARTPTPPRTEPKVSEPDRSGMQIAIPLVRHEQEEASPEQTTEGASIAYDVSRARSGALDGNHESAAPA